MSRSKHAKRLAAQRRANDRRREAHALAKTLDAWSMLPEEYQAKHRRRNVQELGAIIPGPPFRGFDPAMFARRAREDMCRMIASAIDPYVQVTPRPDGGWDARLEVLVPEPQPIPHSREWLDRYIRNIDPIPQHGSWGGKPRPFNPSPI